MTVTAFTRDDECVMICHMQDPYQPPSSRLSRPGDPGLYPVHGIVIGTVLGSLAAGIVMLCLNYRSLGKEALARKAALWGGIIYVILIGLSSLLPGSMAVNVIVILGQAGLAYFVAEQLQGAAIRYHATHGRPLHSNLRAAGIGLLTGMVLIFVLLTAALLTAALSGELAPAKA